jgi:hypothetical protein
VWPFSGEMEVLLSRVGCSRRREPDSSWEWRLHCGKWLFKPSHWRTLYRHLASDQPHSRLMHAARILTRSHPLLLARQPGSLDWDMALLRDSLIGKASFFDLSHGKKTVCWLGQNSFAREINSERWFRDHGVSTLAISIKDADNWVAEQDIVGTAFLECSPSVAPIDDQLLLYLEHASVLVDVHEYTEGALRNLDGLEGLFDWRMLDIVVGGLKRLMPQGYSGLPTAMVHGDFAARNIVRDSTGTAYIIDFDRAFEAASYYDFVYAWLDGSYTRQNVEVAVDRIDRRLGLDRPRGMSVACAMGAFIIDNIRYLKALRTGDLPMNKVHDPFTVRLIQTATEEFRRELQK